MHWLTFFDVQPGLELALWPRASLARGGCAMVVPEHVQIQPLAAHREYLPLLEEWFIAEWPGWYGPGGPGDARGDLESFADGIGLPVGVVAIANGKVCGIAALKADSIASHGHLSPWAAAGLVPRGLRGRGIGGRLLGGLEQMARQLGYAHIYCATSTAESLLLRSGWKLLETTLQDGRNLGIYRKPL